MHLQASPKNVQRTFWNVPKNAYNKNVLIVCVDDAYMSVRHNLSKEYKLLDYDRKKTERQSKKKNNKHGYVAAFKLHKSPIVWVMQV